MLGALAIVGGIAATEMIVTAVAGLVVVTAIAGGRRLTDDSAGIAERLRATSRFGREVFGEIGWHEPEEP